MRTMLTRTLAAVLLASTGCSLTVDADGVAAPAPPSGLSYSANPAVYTRNVAIAPNTPSSSGSAVTSYSVSPALPAGLALDGASGVISGTPTAVTAQATYTVTATNALGSTTVVLAIRVNDAAPDQPDVPDEPGGLHEGRSPSEATRRPAGRPRRVLLDLAVASDGADPRRRDRGDLPRRPSMQASPSRIWRSASLWARA